MERHEKYHSLRGYIWRRSGGDALASRACTDQHLVGHAPVSRRNAGKQRGRQRARDAGEHHRCESLVPEIGVFFGTTAVEIWVSLLES